LINAEMPPAMAPMAAPTAVLMPDHEPMAAPVRDLPDPHRGGPLLPIWDCALAMLPANGEATAESALSPPLHADGFISPVTGLTCCLVGSGAGEPSEPSMFCDEPEPRRLTRIRASSSSDLPDLRQSSTNALVRSETVPVHRGHVVADLLVGLAPLPRGSDVFGARARVADPLKSSLASAATRACRHAS
jgi:hypothetical protein